MGSGLKDVDGFISHLMIDGNVSLPGGSHTEIGMILSRALENSVKVTLVIMHDKTQLNLKLVIIIINNNNNLNRKTLKILQGFRLR